MAIIRKTKTVESLLNFFDQKNEAVSIIELIDHFNGAMDKSTVYRILDRLEGSNILHSFLGNDGVKRYAKHKNENYEKNEKEIHPHFVCKNCGISSCLPIKISIPVVPNYIIESAEHLLIGQCKECLS